MDSMGIKWVPIDIGFLSKKMLIGVSSLAQVAHHIYDFRVYMMCKYSNELVVCCWLYVIN